MSILLYKSTDPKYVKFQRLFMGWLAIASIFLRDINLVWLFFAITLLGIFTGSRYSLPTLLYKLLFLIFRYDLVTITSHHIRYYEINIAMDFIDHLLRLMASSIALLLFYNEFIVATWMLMSFLSVFMMLSAYFGFCLSALSYIGLQGVRQKFHRTFSKKPFSASCNSKQALNQNCVLAKRCFTPYQRCDSCHVDIGKCLGTKFNSLIMIIGVLMSLFLFITHPIFVQVNIVFIMAMLFWLGYHINYSTDDLAKSNDDNIKLNRQLQEYTHSLEDEVKRRTAEIEHLATHDMLTNLFNRFSFEKVLVEALEEVDAKVESHLAFIDLDKFKLINDTAGHLAGDQLLCDMAKKFTMIAADKGVVGRIGGDEFAILFRGISQEEAAKSCQEICDQAEAYQFVWEDETFSIGASIGLVTLSPSIQDIKACFHHADVACYLAKKSGRNQVKVSTT